MMTENKAMSWLDRPITCLSLAVILVAVIGLTMWFTQACWRAVAIENGVAEWRIDAKTGVTEFAWLPCELLP